MKGLLMALGGAAIGLGVAGMCYHQRKTGLNQMSTKRRPGKTCRVGHTAISTLLSPAGGAAPATTVESYPTNAVETQVGNDISPVQQYSASPTLAFPPNLTITVPGAASLDNMGGSGAQNIW